MDCQTKDIKMVSLKQIDFSKDSIMSKIMQDLTDKINSRKEKVYFSVTMGRYKKGNIVRFIESESDVYDSRLILEGYTVRNGTLFVFCSGFSNYKYIMDNQNQISIKTGEVDYAKDILDISYYYILDDIYARFDPESGWIWSDGKPDE